MKEDITKYPPIISIIYSLIELGVKPCLIGKLSNDNLKQELLEKGFVYYPSIDYKIKEGNLRKLYRQIIFKKKVHEILKNTFSPGDLIWIFNLETIILLNNVIEQYPTITHFFEFSPPHFNWKYKLLNPLFSLKKTLHSAWKVIHCEYNRAQITSGLYDLEILPTVLPNKPYVDEQLLIHFPLTIGQHISSLKTQIGNRKVILYQGGFNKLERPLEAFCESINYLPDEFIFVLMGPDSPYRSELQSKYSSDRVIIADYIPAPYHLLATELAYITILSYYPSSKNFADVLNPIYCAPNKLYEYAKYGKPMIGNNIPGLYYDFRYYNCGICINSPLNPNEIAEAVLTIKKNYNDYSVGSNTLYNSIDFKSIIKNILDK